MEQDLAELGIMGWAAMMMDDDDMDFIARVVLWWYWYCGMGMWQKGARINYFL